MDESEAVVAEWLHAEGDEFHHLTDGDDPPDFVVDGDIAVEVTTISPPAYRRLIRPSLTARWPGSLRSSGRP